MDYKQQLPYNKYIHMVIMFKIFGGQCMFTEKCDGVGEW